MSSRAARRIGAALIAAGAAAALAGCAGDSSFSKEEMRQFKEGGPKQMPPQAREMLSKMGQPGNQGAPPRPVGQPGPGSPVGGGASLQPSSR